MTGMQRHFKLRPSRTLTVFLFTLCLLALVSIWSLPFPASVLLVLTLIVLGWGGYRVLFDAGLRMEISCVAFRQEDSKGIVLVLRNGSHLTFSLSGDSLVTPYVVILNVARNEQHGGRSVVIMPDTMGAESFRRLRVLLRWGGADSQTET